MSQKCKCRGPWQCVEPSPETLEMRCHLLGPRTARVGFENATLLGLCEHARACTDGQGLRHAMMILPTMQRCSSRTVSDRVQSSKLTCPCQSLAFNSIMCVHYLHDGSDRVPGSTAVHAPNPNTAHEIMLHRWRYRSGHQWWSRGDEHAQNLRAHRTALDSCQLSDPDTATSLVSLLHWSPFCRPLACLPSRPCQNGVCPGRRRTCF